jgi:hypothetical protein
MSWINRSEIPGAAGEALERMLSQPALLAVDAAGFAVLLYAVVKVVRNKSDLSPAMRTSCALGAAGLLQLPILVSVHHFVVSGYPPRFFFLLHAGLACAAGGAILWSILNLFSEENRRVFAQGASTLLLSVLLLLLPARKDHPDFELLREEARQICASNADLLLGSYWQVYLTASLEPNCPAPLPHNGVNRMPWTLRQLAGRAMLVEETSAPGTPEGSDRTYLDHRIRQTGPWRSVGRLKAAEFSGIPQADGRSEGTGKNNEMRVPSPGLL